MPVLSLRPRPDSMGGLESNALVSGAAIGFDAGIEPARPNRPPSPPAHAGIFTTCANPGCSSGWLKLFRPRSTPVFEGGWCCSEACVRAVVEVALRREMDAPGMGSGTHRHRIPLGLAMLERGWITGGQLRGALEAQKAARGGRFGYWLVRNQGVSEQLVTRALGLQWSCPVLGAGTHQARASPRWCRGCLSTPLGRCRFAPPRGVFCTWDLKTVSTRCWPWLWRE